MTRNPNVAGMFYSNNKEELGTTIKKLLDQALGDNSSQIVISPHAGLTYSGFCAAHSFKSLNEDNTFVILGTNHNCSGNKIITDSEDVWNTPLGNIKVDLKVKERLRLWKKTSG